MTRPAQTRILHNGSFGVIKVETLWCITYQDKFIQLSEDIINNKFKNIRKYHKTIYSTYASAIAHSKKLNKIFNSKDFSVACLYDSTQNKE